MLFKRVSANQKADTKDCGIAILFLYSLSFESHYLYIGKRLSVNLAERL